MTNYKPIAILLFLLTAALMVGCLDTDDADETDTSDTLDTSDSESGTNGTRGTDTNDTATTTDSGSVKGTDSGTDTVGDSETGTMKDTDTTKICEYNGETFDAGDLISSVAGTNCRDCVCDADGTVGCVDTECVQMCEYGDKIYSVGQSFPDSDGCNTCNCGANGNVACTKMACATPCTNTPGLEYYEPGCGGADDMPVITQGCYQSCSGTPCKDGVCQETDINPCICEEGKTCCNACGSRENLCLNAPTTCGAANTRFAITGGGKSFGECMGECQFAFTTNVGDSGECATVTLDVCGWGTDGCTRNNSGQFTPLGNAKLSGLAVELTGHTLEKVYGCPDCTDGGASQLTLIMDGTSRDLSYEFANPPQILNRVDMFTMSVIDALSTCTSNENIIVGESCITGDSK